MIQALIVREMLRRIVKQTATSPQQAQAAMATVDTAITEILAKRVKDAMQQKHETEAARDRAH